MSALLFIVIITGEWVFLLFTLFNIMIHYDTFWVKSCTCANFYSQFLGMNKELIKAKLEPVTSGWLYMYWFCLNWAVSIF